MYVKYVLHKLARKLKLVKRAPYPYKKVRKTSQLLVSVGLQVAGTSERATEGLFIFVKASELLGLFFIQLTPDNSNLQEKSKKVRVIGSSSYQG